MIRHGQRRLIFPVIDGDPGDAQTVRNVYVEPAMGGRVAKLAILPCNRRMIHMPRSQDRGADHGRR